MEDLSIEEKAKRYDEAIEKAKKVLLDCTTEERNTVEFLHPELKERGGDRIRKQILKILNYYKDEEKSEGRMPTEIDECITWLENKDENNPTNIDGLLQAEYKKGWDDAIHQLPQEVDTQIWRIACASAKTWEESFAILNATQKAYNKGKNDALKAQHNSWSEEDQMIYLNILNYYMQIESPTDSNGIPKEKYIEFIKSIDKDSHWKPTEKQIVSLRWILNNIPYCTYKEEISGLLEQILKL